MLEAVHFVFVLYLIIQTLTTIPESPRFNYSKKRFEFAKENLTKVASVNGIENFNSDNFFFDTEQQNRELDAARSDVMSNKTVNVKDGGNEYGITTAAYVKNTILMTLLFTCFSFSFWLTNF